MQGDALADTFQTCADILSKPLLPVYRAVILSKAGTVVDATQLHAENDEQALQLARAMVDGHAVELWDGLRFIDHFPAVD